MIRILMSVSLALSLMVGTASTASAKPNDRVVLRAAVAGDFIDTNSRHQRVWEVWPRNRKSILLGDIVHKNSPRQLWQREYVPRWGSLPTCKVWSVLGNHGWGWSRGQWSPPARGRTYQEFRGAFHRQCAKTMGDRYQWVKMRPGWLLVGLNTENCSAATQLMRQATDRWPRRNVAVFTHRPPILPPGSNAPPLRCPELTRLIDRKAELVMSGHSHRFWRQGKYIVAGTGDGKGYANLTLRRSGKWQVSFVRSD